MKRFDARRQIQRYWVHDCKGENFSRLLSLRLHLRRRRRVVRHVLALLLMRHWCLLLHRLWGLLALDLSLLSLIRPPVIARGLLLLVLGRIALLGVLLLLWGILLLLRILLWVLCLGRVLRWILFLRIALWVTSWLLHLRIRGIG